MKTLCVCGFDYRDFIAQHSIPLDAQFSCPSCEAPRRVDDRDAVTDEAQPREASALQTPPAEQISAIS